MRSWARAKAMLFGPDREGDLGVGKRGTRYRPASVNGLEQSLFVKLRWLWHPEILRDFGLGGDEKGGRVDPDRGGEVGCRQFDHVSPLHGTEGGLPLSLSSEL